MRSIFYRTSRDMQAPLQRTIVMSDTPSRKTLYTYTIHLLTLRYLSRLPLGSTELKTLIIPALGTNLVQRLLLITARSGASLATALPRLQGLGQGGIVTVQRVALQVILVFLVGESKGAVFGVLPAGTCLDILSVCSPGDVVAACDTYPGTGCCPPSPR